MSYYLRSFPFITIYESYKEFPLSTLKYLLFEMKNCFSDTSQKYANTIIQSAMNIIIKMKVSFYDA